MKSVWLRNLVLFISVMRFGWSGSEFVWNVSLVGQVWMQDVSGIWCDSAEELVVRGAEQVGDGRQVVIAVAEPLAATSRDARDQWLNTCQTMPARRTQSARWEWHGRCRAETWLACSARGAHALRTACGCSTTAAWWRGQRLSAQLKQRKNKKNVILPTITSPMSTCYWVILSVFCLVHANCVSWVINVEVRPW